MLGEMSISQGPAWWVKCLSLKDLHDGRNVSLKDLHDGWNVYLSSTCMMGEMSISLGSACWAKCRSLKELHDGRNVYLTRTCMLGDMYIALCPSPLLGTTSPDRAAANWSHRQCRGEFNRPTVNGTIYVHISSTRSSGWCIYFCMRR